MFDLMLRNKTPLKQYNLIVTGTGWTTSRAIGIPYQCIDGTWRLRFNIAGAVSSASRTAYTVDIANVSASFVQPISVVSNTSIACMAYIIGTSVEIRHLTATTTQYFVSGDVELSSKPPFVE